METLTANAIAEFNKYGPVGAFLALTLVALIVLGMVIRYQDTQRTMAAKERAAEWQAQMGERVKEWREEREFYQNHLVSSLAQHEERAQERHTATMAQAHQTALILERLLERSVSR